MMLDSVVDGRSGTSLWKFRCVNGEDAEIALLCLFKAKAHNGDTAFQGAPELIHLDSSPTVKSFVFQSEMKRSGIEWTPLMLAVSGDRRVTSLSKRTVVRPFRTVKEARETLYHFYESGTEAEVNLRLSNFINNYADKPHRREPRRQIEDWWPTFWVPASGKCVP